MIEKLSLRCFWVFMLTCAFSTIGMIWLDAEPEEMRFFMIVPTTLILGIAAFLIWVPHIVYRCIETLSK